MIALLHPNLLARVPSRLGQARISGETRDFTTTARAEVFRHAALHSSMEWIRHERPARPWGSMAIVAVQVAWVKCPLPRRCALRISRSRWSIGGLRGLSGCKAGGSEPSAVSRASWKVAPAGFQAGVCNLVTGTRRPAPAPANYHGKEYNRQTAPRLALFTSKK